MVSYKEVDRMIEETPDEPDEEGGDENPDEEKKEKKPFKLGSDNALWQYSTRIMGQTILGKISASAENKSADKTPDDKADTQKSSEEGVTVSIPVIGLDGTTADGSVPYEILKRQLAFMR